MPFHCLPQSRRAFLKISAAGVVTALASGAQADDSGPDADSWILLADTHIPEKQTDPVRGVLMADNLTRVRGEILELATPASGVLINGDCAYLDGQEGDYRQLGELLEPLVQAGLPVHVTLGNHDERARFARGLAAAQPAEVLVEGRHVSVVNTPRARFFLLDSLDKTNVTPGLLGKAQLEWLAKALDEQADLPAIVLAHHHPSSGSVVPGLLDTEALFRVLLPRRHVKAFAFGHTHHWQVTEREGLHLINLPPVAYVFDAADPNGWVHATLRDDGLDLELHCLDQSHTAHRQKVALKWRSA